MNTTLNFAHSFQLLKKEIINHFQFQPLFLSKAADWLHSDRVSLRTWQTMSPQLFRSILIHPCSCCEFWTTRDCLDRRSEPLSADPFLKYRIVPSYNPKEFLLNAMRLKRTNKTVWFVHFTTSLHTSIKVGHVSILQHSLHKCLQISHLSG